MAFNGLASVKDPCKGFYMAFMVVEELLQALNGIIRASNMIFRDFYIFFSPVLQILLNGFI